MTRSSPSSFLRRNRDSQMQAASLHRKANFVVTSLRNTSHPTQDTVQRQAEFLAGKSVNPTLSSKSLSARCVAWSSKSEVPFWARQVPAFVSSSGDAEVKRRITTEGFRGVPLRDSSLTAWPRDCLEAGCPSRRNLSSTRGTSRRGEHSDALPPRSELGTWPFPVCLKARAQRAILRAQPVQRHSSSMSPASSPSQVPVTTALDPRSIPLTKCPFASDTGGLDVKVKSGDDLREFAGDTMVFCFFDERPRISMAEHIAKFDAEVLKGSLEELVEERDFKAEIGSTETQRLAKGNAVRTVGVVGLGHAEEFTPARAVRVGAALASLARRHKSKTIGVVLPGNADACRLIKAGSDGARLRTKGICAIIQAEAENTGGKDGAAQLECLADSSTHSNYDVVRLRRIVDSLMVDLTPDNRFRGSSTDNLGKGGGDGRDSAKLPPLNNLEIFFSSSSPEKTLSEHKRASVASVGRSIANGVHFTRELVEAPANYCNTVSLANAAIQLAEEEGLKARVLDVKDIEELKMGLYLAVGKGSLYPPKFIHLTYTPKDGVVRKKLAFIGKGICFDSGGYNIKSAASQIELMKYDMSGAGAVLGSAKAVAQLKPPGVEVHFIIAAAENMVSRDAYRPGDVIVASNGKTVEVGNTDAEGRLTLADALVYAEGLQVDFIVDLATLTGACVVALGGKMCGLFSNTESLSAKLQGCAELAGEYVWPLPIPPEYREALESKVADLNNVGGPKGGALIAAVFLQQFVESTPWAHFDIAGTAWNWKEKKATGFGVRTIVEFIRQTSRAVTGADSV